MVVFTVMQGRNKYVDCFRFFLLAIGGVHLWNMRLINIIPVITVFVWQKTMYGHTSKIVYHGSFCCIVLHWLYCIVFSSSFSFYALVANKAIDW